MNLRSLIHLERFLEGTVVLFRLFLLFANLVQLEFHISTEAMRVKVVETRGFHENIVLMESV